MWNGILEWLQQVTGSMSTLEWAIAGVLALVLLVAVVQQLAKTALLVMLLVGVGLFLMNGRIENWSF